ncbi:MAG: isoprenylcysteine carboxylmethyltransferase family protein, partial [Planctomycetaceae bacterium]
MLEKRWIVRSRAWLAILIILPFAAIVAVSEPLIPLDDASKLGVWLVGWSLFLLGALYRWWATLYIGGRKGEELICEGPYSLCRNPLYFGTFSISMSIAALICSLSFAVGVLAASVFYLAVTVREEERRLQIQFGDEFLSYRERVPMFVPLSTSYHSPERIQ